MLKVDFEDAYKKASEINEVIHLHKRREKFVELNEIARAIKLSTDITNIMFAQLSFSQFMPLEFVEARSMRKIDIIRSSDTGEYEKTAYIAVNSDCNALTQRFAAAHEMGNLLLTDTKDVYAELYKNGKYAISKHVDVDISSLLRRVHECECLKAEYAANIFALLVLVPEELKIADINKGKAKYLAQDYGVSEEAILSRLILTNT